MPLTVIKSGAGTLSLMGVNTFSGDLYVYGGVLAVGATSNLGGSGTLRAAGGSLRALADFTLTKPIAGALTLDTNGYRVSLAQRAESPITKIGSGTLVSMRPEVGAVTVNAGTLEARGALSGEVTLNGGRLDATGRLNLVNGGNLSVGDGRIGTLIVDKLEAPTVELRLELQAGESDFLYLADFNFTRFTLDVRDLGGAVLGKDYPFLGFVGTVPSPQPFPSPFQTFSLSTAAMQAGWQGVFTVHDGYASVRFTAVPEPTSAAFLVLGGGVMACWRRRRGV